MQIYSRHSRRRVRYALRCLQGTMTREDWAALFLAVSILLALVMWPGQAGAQEDPIGGTVPPITGIACLPDTHSVAGCEDHVYLPLLAALWD